MYSPGALPKKGSLSIYLQLRENKFGTKSESKINFALLLIEKQIKKSLLVPITKRLFLWQQTTYD
ncbi:MAG: hypothetical protein DRR16_15435 [Candidatus Parabeggiatoa sp. nov. 3]|nr:MAG: hypothetical protein DRR00_27200 [Gammaproteobacteria bacterium]RKZ58968.1 MAG: hypothetical protein DRQ99_24590 [Gammaproteobacteria bacterium]RKZ84174.1 MAG: hypothetical protein DRR16_15435 [Gammaproteobacteria bacterium]